ncbi:hypothetical protein Tco_1491759 [Tanacetum coccineum]
MAFEQSSSKPGLQGMTSGQISSGLDLTYAPSTITTQQPTEGELDLLFEAMYDDNIGGQPSAALRTIPAAQVPQVLQTQNDEAVVDVDVVQVRRTSLTGFPAQSIRSSNAIALDSSYFLVLVTGASQSRQHESHHRFFPVDTSLIHIESRKSPTKSLIDVGSRRISIFTVNTKEYHSDVLAIITRIMRRT